MPPVGCTEWWVEVRQGSPGLPGGKTGPWVYPPTRTVLKGREVVLQRKSDRCRKGAWVLSDQKNDRCSLLEPFSLTVTSPVIGESKIFSEAKVNLLPQAL